MKRAVPTLIDSQSTLKFANQLLIEIKKTALVTQRTQVK